MLGLNTMRRRLRGTSLGKLRTTVLALAGAVLATAAIAQTEPVVVGTAVAPIGMANAAGEPSGYAVEVMRAVAEKAGFEVKFVVMPFGEVLPALVDGKIDISAHTAALTPERLSLPLAFSEPFMRVQDALVVKATDTRPYTSYRDFAGQTVVAANGSAYLTDLQAIQKNENLFREVVADPAQTPQAFYGWVQDGRAKAAVVGDFSVKYQLSLGRFGDLKIVETYVPTRVTSGRLWVRNEDAELLIRINKALAQLTLDGSVAEIADRWGVTPP